jgi:regulator of sigma E protease
MSILIFIAVIVALIIVHEFGHFIAAKLSGMRVEEFGLGYPPRAFTIAKRGETRYTLNWLPFGGFVKIYGENGDADGPRAFGARPRLLQAFVLVAGVAMNLLFAYLLITGALISGTPRALSPEEVPMADDLQLLVANVLPQSPAAEAGIVPGDFIVSAEDGHFVYSGINPQEFTEFVSSGNGNTTIALTVRHADGREEVLFARPEAGLIEANPARAILGIELATVGVIPLSFLDAITEGARITWGATVLTCTGLLHFFYGLFTFSADLSQVAGPVGIAGIVGTASGQGIGDLLSIVALISINLALINLIPVPALDGGRLLFVIIESIIRRPINLQVTRALNALSFALLLLLMVVVTAHDIFKLVK